MTDLPALRRDSRHGLVAGLCSALAERWQVDPMVVRVGMIVATVITNGLGLLAYIALWLAIPSDAPHRHHGQAGRMLLAAILVLAAITGLSAQDDALAFVSLCGLCLVLLWRSAPRSGRAVAPPPLAQHPWDGAPQWNPPPFAGGATASTPSHGRLRVSWPRIAGFVTLAWACIVALRFLGLHVGPLAFPASALGVLGLALITSARSTRPTFRTPHGLVPVGVVLAMVTLLGSVPDGPAGPPASTRVLAASVETLHEHDQLPLGSNTLDLRQLALEDDATVTVNQDAGRLVVLLPEGVGVRVLGRVDVGDLSGPSGGASGMDLTLDESFPVEGQPTLTLRVGVDMGTLEVHR